MAGIAIDPSIEITEKKTITEARKVPGRRIDLKPKDEKALSLTIKHVQNAIRHTEQAIKSLDKISATDFGGEVPSFINELEDLVSMGGSLSMRDYLDKCQDSLRDFKREEEESLVASSDKANFANEKMNEMAAELEDDSQEIEDAMDDEVTGEFDDDEDPMDDEEPMDDEFGDEEDDVKIIRPSDAEDHDEYDDMDDEEAPDPIEDEMDDGDPVGDDMEGAEEEEPKIPAILDRMKGIDSRPDELGRRPSLKRASQRSGRNLRSRYGIGNPKGRVVGESTHVYKDAYSDYESDVAKPINVSKGKANAEQLYGAADPKNTKDEGPTQLHTGDEKSPQDQSDGHDLEAKFNVPSSIKSSLRSEIANIKAEAKKMGVTNKESAYFYTDMANAFEELLGHLEHGTIHHFKDAQHFATSLMGPMLHKIPANVWKFLANGGETRSLKDYMKKVKDPITGPRNTIK